MKVKYFFAAALFAVLALVIGIYLFSINRDPSSDGTKEINFYYVSSATGALETEKRRLKLPDNREEAVKTVYNEYMNGPANSTFALPAEELDNFTTLVYPVDNNENIAKINFTDSFYTLSESKRVLCIAGMVYTLTELDFLRNVYFYVDNEPVVNSVGEASERYNRNNVANNPSLDPEKRDRQLVVLYFTDARQRGLLREDRSIEIKQSQTTEYQIVEQIIQGPLDSSLVPTVSADIKIRDIKTEEGICYVNLSADVTSRHTSVASEQIAVYSIVNSLTELDYVNKVQFLVEGEKINEYRGGVDMSKTLSRDDAIIYRENEEKTQ